MTDAEVKQKAEEHWEFLERWLHMMFVDAWIHSHKHCLEEIEKYLSSLIIGIDGCEFEERLDGDKGCIVLDMTENQWKEYWQSLKKGA